MLQVVMYMRNYSFTISPYFLLSMHYLSAAMRISFSIETKLLLYTHAFANRADHAPRARHLKSIKGIPILHDQNAVVAHANAIWPAKFTSVSQTRGAPFMHLCRAVSHRYFFISKRTTKKNTQVRAHTRA